MMVVLIYTSAAIRHETIKGRWTYVHETSMVAHGLSMLLANKLERTCYILFKEEKRVFKDREGCLNFVMNQSDKSHTFS